MAKRTPLYEAHLAQGAKIVDFAGWDMPLHYGSQVEEHHRVRREAGMFDVSHMGILELEGEGARPFLRRLLANDVDRLRQPGKALYSCMLNEHGGVLDDLIVYCLAEDRFRVVVNAATRERDRAWMELHAASHGVRVREHADLAMIAVQGPSARDKARAVLDADVRAAATDLEPFRAAGGAEQFVARTGYTGEDGLEVMVPAARAAALWQALLEAGVAPAGLGARDTLRLEAGLNLYGADMDGDTTPLETGLAWTVAWEPAARDFIGRAALEAQRAAVPRKLIGLVLEGRGVLRAHQEVVFANGARGEITSGSFSPTLGRSIGLARVPAGAQGECRVDVRGAPLPARVVKPPFVRHGKSRIEL
jgi:aminomethyltransferase